MPGILYFQKLKKETLDQLLVFVKSPGYPNFLKELIIQGLIKIEEPVVEIQIREEDRATVNNIVRITSLT